MTTPVALLQDNGEPLVLDGAITVRVTYPGTLTSSPLADRTYAADGKTNQPATIVIDVIVSPSPTLEGLTKGPARLTEVSAWLERAYTDADVLDVQTPRTALLLDYVLESYTDETNNTDSKRITINLKQAVIASSLSVALTRQTTPTDEAVSGLSDEGDQGTTTTTERPTSLLLALGIGVGLAESAGG